ncbi:MAG: efflux RND transporter permease subunit, partial [Candidatus Porifericomitaceae bacterium WSBS_2022_MAG_OTU9]
MLLAKFIGKNHLLINLCLLVVVAVGILSWQRLPQEMFPAVQLDLVRVGTIYEGATPSEVQQQVSIVIENLFDNNRDVDYVSSLSEEGISQVYLHLKSGIEVDQFIDDARTLVESAIVDLPQNAERPQIGRVKTQFPVISASLYGNVSESQLQLAAKNLQKELLSLPGVANAGISGDREYEIQVAVDPYHLAALGIGMAEAEAAISNNLRDRPGGSITGVGREIRLRSKGESSDVDVIAAIPVRSGSGDRLLTLGDIADISVRLEKAESYARFKGRPSINIVVTKNSEASTVAVAQEVRQLVDRMQSQLPSSLNIGLHSDLSKYVKVRLNTVMSSGLLGLLLLLLSLYLLLNWRVAVVTALGIPVSFLVAVTGLYYLGYTVNMVSLFAFLVVLGMVVDDAIIVTENIYRHLEQGESKKDAIENGLREVIAPVFTATLTTIAAFMPIFAISGTLGLFIEVIPVVVSLCLIGSMLEAFLVLPGHVQLLVRPGRSVQLPGVAIISRYANRILGWSLRFRYLTLAATCCTLLLSVVYAQTRLPFQLFGQVDIGQFIVNIEAPNTYSIEDSKVLAEQVEQAISGVLREGEAVGIEGNVGVSFIDFQRFVRGSNLLQFVVDLETPAPEGFVERWISPLVSMDWSGGEGYRERDSSIIVDEVRRAVSGLPGVVRVKIDRPEAGPEGRDIDIGVYGDSQPQLRLQAEQIASFLRAIPGVKDVQHDQEPGKPEFHYALNERGRNLGLSQNKLGTAVQGGYLGRKLAYANLAGERVPVRLIYSEYVRQDAASFST